jgi:hypothetical protein
VEDLLGPARPPRMPTNLARRRAEEKERLEERVIKRQKRDSRCIFVRLDR